jgi:hypothetical protein
MSAFVWETATWRERGAMVRHHAHLGEDAVQQLFNLSGAGVYAILRGHDWSPAFDADYQPPPSPPEG